MRLEFSNLPLDEVVLRAFFEHPIDLSIPLIVEYVNSLGSDFQDLKQLEQLDLGPDARLVGGVGFPGFRINYKDCELTLQPNLILARWSRNTDKPYPRYEQLRTALNYGIEALRGLKIENRIHIVNMTYINSIVPVDGVGNSHPIRDYIREEFLPSVLLNKDVNDVNVSWKDTSGVDLRLLLAKSSVQVPVAKPDLKIEIENKAAYGLTTICGKFVAPGQDVMLELDQTHDSLQSMFISALTDNAKEEWGYASDSA